MRYPNIEQFYLYPVRRNTNCFVGYHVETIEYELASEDYSLLCGAVNDEQPLFMYHGEEQSLVTDIMIKPDCQVLEIGFEVKPNQIYVCRDQNEYYDLFDRTDWYAFGPTDVCLKLIEEGRRWFLLTNHETGGNESFLIKASELVKSVDIVQVDQYGNRACPVFLQNAQLPSWFKIPINNSVI